MSFELMIGIFVILFILFATGFWWRHYTLACPATLSWLVENPYMNAVAGPDKLLLRLNLEKDMRLLDVGSGPGRLTLPAAQKVGKKGEVVAMDIQSKMLEKLSIQATNMKIENIRTLHAEAGSGKTDKNYFHRALLVTVLGEIPNKHEALIEIHHALKDDGILSITEVIPDPHYVTIKRVRALCHDAGFKEIESFGNWLAFTINFKKETKILPR